MTENLRPGLDAFTEQLSAQVQAVGIPQHENSLHHCLALGFQSAFCLGPGAIVFERPLGPGNCDLWMQPWDLAIEVKYFRPIPSGATRPMPQHFGSLLADFCKLVQTPVTHRFALLVADPPATGYLLRNTCGLLPMAVGGSADIDSTGLTSLSATAASGAESKGSWRDLTVSLAWTSRVLDVLDCYAWEVTPANGSRT